MDIQTGDIILIKGTFPIISPLVRWFTNSEYTHVGVAVNSHSIYEIDIDKKMGIHPLDYPYYDIFRYKYGLTYHQKEKMIRYANQMAKKSEGYDWLRIISFALEKFFKFPFIFDQVNREVCSEIVDYIYGSVGIDLVPNRVNGDVRPSDLARSPVLIKVDSSVSSTG